MPIGSAPGYHWFAGLSLWQWGYAWLALPGTGGAYWTTFFAPITVLGLGMAITVAPLTTTVMRAAGTDRSGLASGINNTVARTASLLAVAVFGILAQQRFGSALGERLQSLAISPDVRRMLAEESRKLAAATIPASVPHELRATLRAAIAGAFVDAFRLLAFLAAGVAMVSALVAWLLIKRELRIKNQKPGP